MIMAPPTILFFCKSIEQISKVHSYLVTVNQLLVHENEMRCFNIHEMNKILLHFFLLMEIHTIATIL